MVTPFAVAAGLDVHRRQRLQRGCMRRRGQRDGGRIGVIAAGRDHAQLHGALQRIGAGGERHQIAVEQHEGRARRQQRRSSPVRCRPARAAAATICRCAAPTSSALRELDHLPVAVGMPHRRGIGAGEHRTVRRPTPARRRKASPERRRAASAPASAAGKSSSVSPTIAGASAVASAAVARAIARTPHRHRPRPRIGEHRQPRQHRRLLAGQRRQIEHQRMHRPDRRRQGWRPMNRGAEREIEHFRIDRARAQPRGSRRRRSPASRSARRRPLTLSPMTSPGVSASRLGGSANAALSRPAHRSCSQISARRSAWRRCPRSSPGRRGRCAVEPPTSRRDAAAAR